MARPHKNKTMTLRVNDAELKRLKTIAGKKQTTISALVRTLIEKL